MAEQSEHTHSAVDAAFADRLTYFSASQDSVGGDNYRVPVGVILCMPDNLIVAIMPQNCFTGAEWFIQSS